MDIKNLEEGYELICGGISRLPGHARCYGEDVNRRRKMPRCSVFVSGDTQIMVATTVIEVGVNWSLTPR